MRTQTFGFSPGLDVPTLAGPSRPSTDRIGKAPHRGGAASLPQIYGLGFFHRLLNPSTGDLSAQPRATAWRFFWWVLLKKSAAKELWKSLRILWKHQNDIKLMMNCNKKSMATDFQHQIWVLKRLHMWGEASMASSSSTERPLPCTRMTCSGGKVALCVALNVTKGLATLISKSANDSQKHSWSVNLMTLF